MTGLVASGLHVSTDTLVVVALVVWIAIGVAWLFGRFHR